MCFDWYFLCIFVIGLEWAILRLIKFLCENLNPEFYAYREVILFKNVAEFLIYLCIALICLLMVLNILM